MKYDLIIIGDGPAGCSAAIYAVRSKQSVLVIAKGNSNLAKADEIENYYGFENPISGKELYERGIAQAKRLGAQFIQDEVVSIEWMEDYLVHTTHEDYLARAVILATGSSRSVPNVPHIQEYEGKGVSYCAICDGFFYRKKPVVVIGNGEYALHEAEVLRPIASSLTICTNGMPNLLPDTKGIAVREEKITKIIGEDMIDAIEFANGETLETRGIFCAIGVAGSFDFAKKLGANVINNQIVVDENMATNLPGLYACGDTTGGLLQVNKAVYEGAKAALAATTYLRKR